MGETRKQVDKLRTKDTQVQTKFLTIRKPVKDTVQLLQFSCSYKDVQRYDEVRVAEILGDKTFVHQLICKDKNTFIICFDLYN